MTLDLHLIRATLEFSARVYEECSIEDRASNTQVLISGSIRNYAKLIAALE